MSLCLGWLSTWKYMKWWNSLWYVLRPSRSSDGHVRLTCQIQWSKPMRSKRLVRYGLNSRPKGTEMNWSVSSMFTVWKHGTCIKIYMLKASCEVIWACENAHVQALPEDAPKNNQLYNQSRISSPNRWKMDVQFRPFPNMLWQALAYPLCATTITLFWFPNVLRFIVSTCICSKWASPSAHLHVPQPLICWGANHQGLQTVARLFRCYFRWRAVVPWFRVFNPCFATSRRHKSLWERRAQ